MLHHGTKTQCSLWASPELRMIAKGRCDEIIRHGDRQVSLDQGRRLGVVLRHVGTKLISRKYANAPVMADRNGPLTFSARTDISGGAARQCARSARYKLVIGGCKRSWEGTMKLLSL